MTIDTGALGQLGSQVVDRLLERGPADRVRVSIRSVAKAASLASRGVRVRVADFTEPGSLEQRRLRRARPAPATGTSPIGRPAAPSAAR